jgi:protein arginine N-methyltransferase 1
MSNPTLEEHLGYLIDPVRHARLRDAVARLIQPGDRVVDLGCGSGVLGLLCLQHGAGFVDAIDETAMIEAARETFKRNGFADRVRTHQDSSFRVELDAAADVLVCDHVGYFGIDYGMLEMLADARKRFLKPGGRILPRRVQLLLGAVHSDACRDKAEGWASRNVAHEFHWLRDHGINARYAVDLTRNDLISDLVQIADLETGRDHPAIMRWQTELTINRDSLLDGVVGCFNAELAEGVWMSNAPQADGAISRHQTFLPIDARLPVRAGDKLSVDVTQSPAKNLIAWCVEHPASGQRFSHSTFAGQLLTQAELARQHPDRRPRLSSKGAARAVVLSYVDGLRTAAEIEAAVLRDHPTLFPSQPEIRRFVASTLGRDTE